VLAPDDPELPLAVGAVSAAFGGRDEVVARPVGARPDLIRDGLLLMVAAHDESGAVVGGGSGAPRGGTAELMGIAVVTSARRQGLGTAATAALVAACRDAGASTVFLSAASDEATSIYERLGFVRRGTACLLGVEA
jgi:ribosomal protein S18 acetylase RimI-like enzyme